MYPISVGHSKCWPVVLLGACLGCEPAPAPPAPVFDPAKVASTMVETLPCRISHDHDLRTVRIFADATSADIFDRCALGQGACSEAAFPEGSLFVKLEFGHPGCQEGDLAQYTAAVKRKPGSYPAGGDWWWQQITPDLQVADEGAPSRCLQCHIDHCGPPGGFDLRCIPD